MFIYYLWNNNNLFLHGPLRGCPLIVKRLHLVFTPPNVIIEKKCHHTTTPKCKRFTISGQPHRGCPFIVKRWHLGVGSRDDIFWWWHLRGVVRWHLILMIFDDIWNVIKKEEGGPMMTFDDICLTKKKVRMRRLFSLF